MYCIHLCWCCCASVVVRLRHQLHPAITNENHTQCAAASAQAIRASCGSVQSSLRCIPLKCTLSASMSLCCFSISIASNQCTCDYEHSYVLTWQIKLCISVQSIAADLQFPICQANMLFGFFEPLVCKQVSQDKLEHTLETKFQKRRNMKLIHFRLVKILTLFSKKGINIMKN